MLRCGSLITYRHCSTLISDFASRKEQVFSLIVQTETLKKRIQSVIDSLKLRQNKSSFLDTKETQIQNIDYISDQCLFLKEFLRGILLLFNQNGFYGILLIRQCTQMEMLRMKIYYF